jgi:hypothetical protein
MAYCVLGNFYLKANRARTPAILIAAIGDGSVIGGKHRR